MLRKEKIEIEMETLRCRGRQMHSGQIMVERSSSGVLTLQAC